ncbi:MAG: UDP-glucose 4-epimerase GalE [Meiothermus sp.]|uniref:UDP-glucose 4-epimerase GalE n=1 Tax=Meiothermus sp. TaxID=1955249 RepID=UPI0025EDB58A|nr:UDP-glucose 4-epimerase GalE [Meiothermus sp.]MCS7058158.1 UDP-glucose 4-epimerase GalE [Meiothermus sp.]MCS7193327.1 UDP-glucose 4-epimerase GalE [Meiothermus sp.]MCX7740880.1 UDP-glucose 4-epimerase GalE [Meiothermus sp.]MDW8091221.1 UDP-glucose 4-epimerase GalE [Meiothermus sp.]MDW8481993.1 UDP-glucose 4-epimerase GalE [Meiothermus sp.]
MNILVVGGAGYIGSHTAKALYRAGFTPVVFDNLSYGHRWAVRWGPLVEADLADKAAILEALRGYRIGAVIHFAANAYVGESMENPAKYFRNNVANMLNLLEAMVETGVRHIVFSSSCATYGIPQTVPIREDFPQNPINPYGETKLVGERMLKWFGNAYGLGWMALRYFNASGADPEGELGEVHDPETHLIPLVIDAVLGRRPPVRIFGTDYPTPDGTAIRDYIHVTDLAEAHVRALEHLLRGGSPTALNLGTGQGTSVLEVVRAVEKVAGRPVPAETAPRRPGDPPALVADPSRAREVLGWEARYRDIVEIVATAWNFATRHPQAAPSV